ncbi:MAG: integrase [Rhodococcus sp. (in: high G+C Gram-positive bacteria)]|nr:MAG: integrase [Rhodococcus sp. (in: high G+C Gram-positive bacteria)]
MSALAPLVEAFFTERLLTQLHASPRTVAAYRDTLRLLLGFVHERTGKPPAQLDIDDLDAELVSKFLTHLEQQRHNSIRTRNARLAAIRSLFRYAALRHPEHAGLIARVLAIPAKRHERGIVAFLTPTETDAVLAAPDRSTWYGRRDHALLTFTMQTGLRVGELVALTRADMRLGTGAYVQVQGKGRKRRTTPLTPQTIAVLRAWLREYAGEPDDPLFPTRRGRHLSIDAVEWLVAKHATTAAESCKSLRSKNIRPHTLRHTAAMRLLQGGVDTSVIALYLGHESPRSTQPYLHADLALKQQALDRTTPPNTKPGRYRPPDKLLAFLEDL